MKFIRNLPNILTLINMLLGCLGIVYIYYDHMVIRVAGEGSFSDMGKIHVAGWLILIAAIIDFSDGFMARILNVQSEMGKQLDSLADMVTFGLLPGLIMYNLIAASFYGSQSGFDYPLILFTSGFLLTMCAALRLAKFNVDSKQSYSFSGMPSPVAAMFIASLPLIMLTDETGIYLLFSKPIVLVAITVIISYLMVSPIPMMSLKFQSYAFSESKWQYSMLIILLLILSIGLILNLKYLVIPLLITVYVIISIAKKLTQDGI